MIYLLVSDDSLFHRMVSETFLQEEEVWSWAGRKKNGDAWPGPGHPFYGDPAEADTFLGVVPGRDVESASTACAVFWGSLKQTTATASRPGTTARKVSGSPGSP